MEPYVPVPDVIPRTDAARTARLNPAKQAPFTVTEGVVVLSLGKVDARSNFHDATHVYPVGYKTEWINSDHSAKFHSEICDGAVIPGGSSYGDTPVFRVTRWLTAKAFEKDFPDDESRREAAAKKANEDPLICDSPNSSLAAWCKMVVESNSFHTMNGEETEPGARKVTSAGTADRFCLDDIDVIQTIEASTWVDDVCPMYQYCEQRGSWAAEGLRRAKYTLAAARELLNVMKDASKAQTEAKAAREKMKRPPMTQEERDGHEVKRVMDKMLHKLEGVHASKVRQSERQGARESERSERVAQKDRERIERKAQLEKEKADRDAAKEREKAEKEAAREAAKVQREKDKEAAAANKEKAKKAKEEQRERKKLEDAKKGVAAKQAEARASQWLHGITPRVADELPVEDGGVPAPGPVTPPPAPEGFGAGVASKPRLAGEVLEVWTFLDRFRDLLFAEPVQRDEHGNPIESPARGGRRRKHVETRAPAEAAPPTPAALAAAVLDGDAAAASALVGALLQPLLATHASASEKGILADALALAPVTDASTSVPGGVWEESLRRYLAGVAASMELPPEGTSVRSAADAAEVVCKHMCGGCPTAVTMAPETGTVTTPSAAAALAATLEGHPKPPPAIAARADAEAMTACEIELYANFAIGNTGEAERRQRAVQAAMGAATNPTALAVRQSVRVLAHTDKFRPPELSRGAKREHGQAAAAVPYYAAVAAGAGASVAARARFPRAIDYEVIDQRCAAGVYAVAALSAHPDDMVAVDSAECGELVSAAHAPQKDAAHLVTQRVCKAARRGRPEGHCSDGLVHLEIGVLTLFGGEDGALPKVAWDDGCQVCGGDVAAGVVLICEECTGEYHCACLDPPLESVPEGEWFCPGCARARECRDPTSRELTALRGTKLDLVTRGLPTPDGELGSTRCRADAARRLVKMGERMGRGWSRCTPGERLDVLRELTLQLLDSSTVRAILDDCERVQFEVHESLRKHIRDFTCYRKYGVSTAERDAIMLAARAEAEAEAEAAEAEAKAAADAKKAAKTETDASPGAEGAEVKEDTDMAVEGGDSRGPGGPKKEVKSYAVRMAGIAAANASVFEIPEKEGRLRWQAKWHELEQQARSADLRLSPVGTDRTGASYYVVAPWGQVAVQPSGGGAVKRVKGSTAASEVNKKRKKPKTETGDANDANDDDDDDDDNNDTSQPQGPDGSTRDENAHLPEEKPWGMYQGVEGLGALAASLNKRGFREGTLWSELERRFGAAPVPCEEAPVKVESRIEPEGAEGDVEMKEPEEPEKDEDNAQKAMAPIGAVRAVPAPPADANGWKAPSPAGAAVDTPEATIAAIRDEILALDAALPDGGGEGRAFCKVRGSKERREAWRRMVETATSPLTLGMACVLLEASLKREWLSPAWLPWSPPAIALRSASQPDAGAAAASVFLRVHALRRAITWGGAQQRRVREEIAPEPMLSREERGARRAAAQAAAQIAAVMKASEMDVDM